MEKTSKIKKCVYNKPWNAPNGDVIHYHSIELENGDMGNVGVSEQFPPKIAQGSEITYTIKGNSIKLIGFSINQSSAPSTNQPAQNNKPAPTNEPAKQTTKPSFPTKTYGKKLDDFLGYTWGYAKDITIAKINAKDKDAIADPMAMTCEYAEVIYAKIREMLKEDWQPTQKPTTTKKTTK
jgi:hypothetical protein